MYVRVISATALTLVIAASAVSASAQEEANDELIQMVVDFLSDDDNDIRSLAFDQIRTEAPGTAATKTFADQLSQLPDASKIGLLSALADRGDAAAKAAVLETLDTLTNAAIQALGKLGDASDCPRLISLLSSSATQKAAREGLVQLQGDSVSTAILAGINTGNTSTRVALIEILTTRRAFDTIPTMLKLAVGSDPKMRTAAMACLGQLAGPEHVAGMTKGVLKASAGAERSNAEKNLMFVCNRIDQKDKQAEPLLAAMKSLGRKEHTIMLSTLGRIGGPSALPEVEKAISSRDATIHAAGLRAIANWPNASVADRLIAIAKTDKHKDHRRLARMALIRIAPLPDGRTDAEKLDLLKAAMKLAAADSERSYALQRAAAIRLPETLRLVVPYLKQTKHAQRACQTIVELAHHRQLRDDNKAEFHAALDQVIAISKDPVVVDRANRYKKGQTWVRPKK